MFRKSPLFQSLSASSRNPNLKFRFNSWSNLPFISCSNGSNILFMMCTISSSIDSLESCARTSGIFSVSLFFFHHSPYFADLLGFSLNQDNSYHNRLLLTVSVRSLGTLLFYHFIGRRFLWPSILENKHKKE